MTRLLLSLLSVVTFASCVETMPPPMPMAPYCPPTPKKTTTTTVAATPPKKPSEQGRLIDGRFIRDTPPELLEPAKTIRVEKDF
jgi:hypothetical protein